jgi:hypothetical protein
MKAPGSSNGAPSPFGQVNAARLPEQVIYTANDYMAAAMITQNVRKNKEGATAQALHLFGP